MMVFCVGFDCLFFFFKQKTAYEMRISDWSSDVCSSDLSWSLLRFARNDDSIQRHPSLARRFADRLHRDKGRGAGDVRQARNLFAQHDAIAADVGGADLEQIVEAARDHVAFLDLRQRSEEHTSEFKSLMRTSYAVFCL